MGVKAYLMEEFIQFDNPVRRFGWLLKDGWGNEQRKCEFTDELSRTHFETAVRIILSLYLNPDEVQVREIAALLFRYREEDDFNYRYLERLLDEHPTMDCNKAEQIHEMVFAISHTDLVVAADYAPLNLLRAEFKNRGLDVSKVKA